MLTRISHEMLTGLGKEGTKDGGIGSVAWPSDQSRKQQPSDPSEPATTHSPNKSSLPVPDYTRDVDIYKTQDARRVDATCLAHNAIQVCYVGQAGAYQNSDPVLLGFLVCVVCCASVLPSVCRTEARPGKLTSASRLPPCVYARYYHSALFPPQKGQVHWIATNRGGRTLFFWVTSCPLYYSTRASI